MQKILISVTLLTSLLLNEVKGQDFNFSQFVNTYSFDNPAYLSEDFFHEFKILYRHQALDAEADLSTFLSSWTIPIWKRNSVYRKKKGSVDISFIYDNEPSGQRNLRQRTSMFSTSFNHVLLRKDSVQFLTLGGRINALNRALTFDDGFFSTDSQFNPSNGFNPNDPTRESTDKFANWYFTGSLGTYLHFPRLDLGLSYNNFNLARQNSENLEGLFDNMAINAKFKLGTTKLGVWELVGRSVIWDMFDKQRRSTQLNLGSLLNLSTKSPKNNIRIGAFTNFLAGSGQTFNGVSFLFDWIVKPKPNESSHSFSISYDLANFGDNANKVVTGGFLGGRIEIGYRLNFDRFVTRSDTLRQLSTNTLIIPLNWSKETRSRLNTFFDKYEREDIDRISLSIPEGDLSKQISKQIKRYIRKKISLRLKDKNIKTVQSKKDIELILRHFDKSEN